MLKLERNWLALVPWQTLVAKNQELCRKDNQPHEPNPKGFERAQRLWHEQAAKTLPLQAALDVFRQVHKLAPFKFFNGNTVAAVAKDMMTDALAPLPSLQAEMARRTVAHYVVGAVKGGELEQVLKHVSSLLGGVPATQTASPAPTSAPPAAAPLPSPTA